ncbi:hypothetical protein QQ045_008181 [Rhodiola kirilowii]
MEGTAAMGGRGGGHPAEDKTDEVVEEDIMEEEEDTMEEEEVDTTEEEDTAGTEVEDMVDTLRMRTGNQLNLMGSYLCAYN